MTRCQSRWVNGIIIELIVILRAPTLLPSLYTTDEGYYGTIANDILDGGAVYRTAVDTKPPGMYYIYAGVFAVAGRNNLFAVHLLAIFVVVATALVLWRIGARVADDWAGAWSGIGYAVFVHAYRPGDTLGANSEIFASLPLALSVLAFLQGLIKPDWGLMFVSGALVGVATLRSFWCRRAVSTGQVLLILWLALSYLAIFIGWRFPGHYHLAVLPPLSILAGQAFSRFVAEQRDSLQVRWRWIRASMIGAVAVPAIAFLIVALSVRAQTFHFFPVVQRIVKETSANDRIFVWGTSPQLYSFSGRRMATRFVSCTHLVAAYASRPRAVRDRGQTVIPETWQMFQADWEAHPP